MSALREIVYENVCEGVAGQKKKKAARTDLGVQFGGVDGTLRFV
jgi:hypothetical protein